MFAKFYEIPLSVQVIKEKPKCRGLRLTKGNNSNRIGPPSPYLSIINVHFVDINVFAKFYEFHHCLFKILKHQNVADGRNNGWTT